MKQISTKRAKTLIEKGAKLIDVRSPILFRDGTIPGAINIPTGRLHELVTFPKNVKYIFFGQSSTDPDLKILLNYASQLFVDVYYIESKDSWDEKQPTTPSK